MGEQPARKFVGRCLMIFIGRDNTCQAVMEYYDQIVAASEEEKVDIGPCLDVNWSLMCLKRSQL